MKQLPQEDQQSTLTDQPRHDDEALRLLVPGLVILRHPEAQRVGEIVALPRLSSGVGLSRVGSSQIHVKLSRHEPLFATPRQETLRPLADPYLSRRPMLLLPGPRTGSIVLELSESRAKVTAAGVSIESNRLFSAEEIERGVTLVLHRRVVLLLCLVDPIPLVVPRFGLVGEAAATQSLRQEIRSAATLDVPVLLRGETGTGKELVARALHQTSRRSHRPYITVNMGALSPALAASELFGAVRGAYTGADRNKPGFFRSANGGTIFLDEIGEASVEVQVMLLRVLESREIQPVGGVDALTVDVRVIAATDAELESAISAGRFRAPLLHRLAGFEIELPPLRTRRDDIARLLFHFLAEESNNLVGGGSATELSPEAQLSAELVARLVAHDWPGNVRQLRNVARRLAIAQHNGSRPAELERLVDQLIDRLPRTEAASATSRTNATRPSETLPDSAQVAPEGFYKRYRRSSDVNERELLMALEKHHWQPQLAAAELGVSRPTIYRLMQNNSKIRKAVDLERTEIEATLEQCEGAVQDAANQLRVSLQGLKRRMTQLGLD